MAPSQAGSGLSVVAITTVDTIRGCEVVPARQSDTGNGFNDVNELVDRHSFGAADIQRLIDVALCQPIGSIHTVGDIGKAPRLVAGSPDFDLTQRPDSLASITLRQIAAGAFSRPPAYAPNGP